MSALKDVHSGSGVTMGIFNGKTVPASCNSPEVEYKAVRENILMVDYSHLSAVSVTGDDAWSLVNHMASADVSTIRDEQGMYSLLLNEDGTIWGDAYILCTDEGYSILSENRTSTEIIARLNGILEDCSGLDIQETPTITPLDNDEWGAVQLEGPYAWELLSEIYGFDIIGLPYQEFMSTDDGLIVFRCSKHGEYAYLLLGQQQVLAEVWQQLLNNGEKYELKTGGLNYRETLRVENPCWEPTIYQNYSVNPVELQLQWAIQYDKEDFIGKDAAEQLSACQPERKLVGMLPTAACSGIAAGDLVLVNGEQVGTVIKGIFSPALDSFIALALINGDYAWSDIDGYEIKSAEGTVIARTSSVPFIYNFSLLVNPTEHSYIDTSKAKSML